MLVPPFETFLHSLQTSIYHPQQQILTAHQISEWRTKPWLTEHFETLTISLSPRNYASAVCSSIQSWHSLSPYSSASRLSLKVKSVAHSTRLICIVWVRSRSKISPRAFQQCSGAGTATP